MIRFSIVCLAAISSFLPAVLSAQTPAHTPAAGSAERSEILSALRKPVELALKQPVVFKIDHFLVQDGWTFIMGQPQGPGNKRINYKDTPYQKAIEEEAFDDSFSALLQKQSDGTWKVISWQIGATDALWLSWPQDFKAPLTVFPPVPSN